MNRIVALVVVGVLLTLAAAYTQDKPPAAKPPDAAAGGLVAVVDLDKAVKDVGLDFQYQSNLAAARQDLEQRLGAVRTRLADDVAKLQAQFKEAKDDKAKAEIQKSIAEKERELRQTATDLQNDLNRFNQKMQQEFRASLQPTLQRLSDAHGGKTLLTRGLAVAYAPPAADLTNELIDELKAHPIKLQTTRPD